jgi:carbamoyltransferase
MNVIGISGLHNSVPFKKREFPNLSSRQYRMVQGLDAAAALVNRHGVQAVAAEERFIREKKTGAFPVNAMRYCLQAANVTPDAIDFIAHGFAYERWREFFAHKPFLHSLYAEVYAPEIQIGYLQEHFPPHDWSQKFVAVPHHLAHAASSFYVSGFQEALILVADGMGELESTTIAVGQDSHIDVLQQVPAPHSLGFLYGVFTHYLGFSMNEDEFKVMGLAPYGNPRRYFAQMMDLCQLQSDGTYRIPFLLQNHTLEEKETFGGSLHILTDLFGPPREPGADITQRDMDIAAAVQSVLEASLMHMLRHYKNKTGQSHLCMAGGVALNCSANGVIKRSRLFKDICIQPASSDDGTALGAALYVQNLHEPQRLYPRMTVPLWGPQYSTQEIEQALQHNPECKASRYDSWEALAYDITQRLVQGQIVALYQGRMEFGPRALGNRSIVADPRDPSMRDRINHLVKKRESFRPFAPAVITEAASEFFDIPAGDEASYAHMLFTTPVRRAYRTRLPAITHVDGSARVQTVTREDNPRFWTLLHEFGKATGIPLLLNTSLNVRGEPIVCTPAEAIETFLRAQLDALVMEDFLVVRNHATHAEERTSHGI